VSDIELSVDSGVATILLNRPDKKNAFTARMIEDWYEFLMQVRDDPAVRAVVLAGAGAAFCSGADLDDLGDWAGKEPSPLNHKRHLTRHIHRIAYAMEDLEQPVIAAVEGPAIGAGMDFSLMCDLRIASETARFSEGYVKVGLVPGDGGCYYLPRLVGMARALELLWTGRFVDAAEAQQIGLVNRVVPAGGAYREALALARQLAAGPPVAIGMIKKATYQSARTDLRTALNLISSDMGVVRSTRDSQEALTAFRERRAPQFSGE
jgi:enoyl-CoA hydratase/carnithine racemase